MSASCIDLRRERQKTPKLNLLKELKKCSNCKKYLKLINFCRNRSKSSGLSNECRACWSVRNAHRTIAKPKGNRRKRPVGRPKEPYYPGAPKALKSFPKRRRVQGTALEDDILMFLEFTLLPQKAIAKRFRVSPTTVRKICKKHFPDGRMYQHGIYEARQARKRPGYGL